MLEKNSLNHTHLYSRVCTHFDTQVDTRNKTQVSTQSDTHESEQSIRVMATWESGSTGPRHTRCRGLPDGRVRPDPSSRQFPLVRAVQFGGVVDRSPSLCFVPVDAHQVGQMVQITEEVRRRP